MTYYHFLLAAVPAVLGFGWWLGRPVYRIENTSR